MEINLIDHFNKLSRNKEINLISQLKNHSEIWKSMDAKTHALKLQEP